MGAIQTITSIQGMALRNHWQLDCPSYRSVVRLRPKPRESSQPRRPPACKISYAHEAFVMREEEALEVKAQCSVTLG